MGLVITPNKAKYSEDARKYGNDAAKALGLPPVDSLLLTTDERVALAYGIVCQVLNRKSELKSNIFLSNKLPGCIEILQCRIGSAAPAHGISSQQHKSAWLDCLKAWPELLSSGQKQTAAEAVAAANAPTILQFWAQLSRLEDLTSFANAPEALDLKLPNIHQCLPNLAECDEAVLVICRKDIRRDSQNEWCPVVGVWLCKQANGQLAPDKNVQLVINQAEFFDRNTNEPVRSMDADAIQKWMSLEEPADNPLTSSPDAVQTAADSFGTKDANAAIHMGWSEFFARWDRLTAHWLQGSGGLAGLCVVLRGPSAPAFSIKFVDSKCVPSRQHAARLEAAAKDLSNDKFHLLKDTLDQVVAPTARKQLRLSDMDCSLFLGHMDTYKNGKRSAAFPLDPTQRMAAMAVSQLAFSKHSELLPVNGPPGTGKTSFLRAALASIWVQAALNKAAHPPVVYGIAATNQAVSNMIEAFSAIRSTVPDGPAYSWLADLASYGWFFPSKKAGDDRKDLMQLQWQDSTKNPYSPSGSASVFGERKIRDHEATLLARAKTALSLQQDDLTIELVSEKTYGRLKDAHKELLERQKQNANALEYAANAWIAAQGKLALMRVCERDYAKTSAKHQLRTRRLALLQIALEVTKLLLQQEIKFCGTWRVLLPKFLRQWLWGRGLRDLAVLRERARVVLMPLARTLHTDMPSLELTVMQMESEAKVCTQTAKDNEEELTRTETLLATLRQVIQTRRFTTNHLFQLTEISPKKDEKQSADITKVDVVRYHLLRMLSRWARSSKDMRLEAYSEWIHHLEAPLDTEIRVRLFHWAARYWECRWVCEELKKAAKSDSDRVQRLMMLGVIIVATTHKVLKLGEARTADLLIMDEAGQCLPEVAAACITYAKNAVFVGDVLQLQPVANISTVMQDSIERQVCSNNTQLPAGVKPIQGSGMKVAQLAARSTSGMDPGVTLLFHYRCVPEIIGYCNELLYHGRIRNARSEPRMSQLEWMPAISWVGVSGDPAKDQGSWTNPQEAKAIVDWLLVERDRLTKVRLPSGELKTYALGDVVAVVTPLKRQAEFLREALENAFGEDEIKKMVIGTVHKLQGAERPVVLFSLVQSHTTNQTLMADRDGGMLMNVAVSRARDAFVVFADRNTLKPAPIDALGETYTDQTMLAPIAFLGRYLRKHGVRLYPSTLVIVEAPGKRKMIEEALGLDAAVIATSGTLRRARLSENGLEWSKSPDEWLGKLTEHAGLIREVLIATDDDLAGELIGMHAADDAANIFAPSLFPGKTITVKRMRFSDITAQSLRAAYQSAGPNFDEQRIAAAIVREFANLIDRRLYRDSGVPMSSYSSAQVRDAVEWLDKAWQHENGTNAADTRELLCTLQDSNGNEMVGFITTDQGGLAKPLALDLQAANDLAQKLLNAPALTPLSSRTVLQQPGLYPANTTARVLAMVVDELGLNINLAQDHLNALYLQGAEPEKEKDERHTT